MKFSDITPASDADRRLAESKKLTIQPIHPYVAPDEIPDDQIATQHLAGPAIANTSNDTEQDAAPLTPSQSALKDTSHRSDGKSVTATIVIFTLAVAVITSGVFLFIHFT